MSYRNSSTRLLGYDEVVALTGLGRVDICRRIIAGTFPSPVKLGRRSKFVEHEIHDWVDALIEQRDAKATGGGQ